MNFPVILVYRLTPRKEFVYSLRMSTFEILNAETNEVAATAASYIEAVGVADHLSFTTKVLHFVTVGVVKTLDYAV